MDKPAQVGGQAVLEGVMMRTPHAMTVAVRKQNGEIVVKETVWQSVGERFRFLRWPFIRGSVVLIEALVNGMQALTFSAKVAMDEEAANEAKKAKANDSDEAEETNTSETNNAETSAAAPTDTTSQADDLSLEKEEPSQKGDTTDNNPATTQNQDPVSTETLETADEGQEEIRSWQLTGTIVLSLTLAFLLFKGVPHLLTWLLGKGFGIDLGVDSVLFHFIDAVIKLGIFVGYVGLISRMEEIRRVFQYHGAEHRAIHAFENKLELTVENAKQFPSAHPRCGTSFILLVLMVSLLVFAVVFVFMPQFHSNGFVNNLLYILIKLPLMLPIAGVAYEVTRLGGRYPRHPLLRPLLLPGLWMQRLTTRDPDDTQLEVGLASLRKALQLEERSHSSSLAPVVRTYATYLEVGIAEP